MNQLCRRQFLRSSVSLAGVCVLPTAILGSCFPAGRGAGLRIDYLGDETGFLYYEGFFNRIKDNRFVSGTLEGSLANDSDIVFVDTDPSTKSAYILMLLEKDKDILTSYPLGNNLSDYTSIAEFREKYGRITGLLNPILFYPSMLALGEIIDSGYISLNRIGINCHPTCLGHDFNVRHGLAGSAQHLQRCVSVITGQYPISLKAYNGENNAPTRITLYYDGFPVDITTDWNHRGWIMELSGEGFEAMADHTGILAIRGGVEPRIAPDPSVMEKAVKANIEDFLQAVKVRSEPRVNHVDGLASIILNTSVEESQRTGELVNL
jgi:predicted dehydrogenase